MKILIRILIVLGILAGAGYAAYPYGMAYYKTRMAPKWRQAEVKRGAIVSVVNSTGTIQPVLQVRIGAFVSGPIEALYVDYNSDVKKGDKLAKIDPRIYEASVARDEATLLTQQAGLTRVQANLQQAVNEEKRAAAFRAENPTYVSESEMDRLKFARVALEAEIKVAEAGIKQAQAQLENSRANLGYTNIDSPVDGTVIDRKIDPGQTLAAQFQTPEMFVVAPEMDKRMYVYASVDEAEIGLIRSAQERKQRVEFTVDAYPDDLFHGEIYQVRINPNTVQNVVTYTVVVEAPNPGRKLLPGMTANLTFEIEKHEKVIKVPNAALRYFPDVKQVREADRKLLEGGEESNTETASAQKDEENEEFEERLRPAAERVAAGKEHNKRHVWVLDGDLLRAIEVITGLNDYKFTEMVSGDLKEGQKLVTGTE